MFVGQSSHDPRAVVQQLGPVPFQPVFQPSPHQFQSVHQSFPSFQPVLQPYVTKATPQPASTPTTTATATATATSTSSPGNSQVGAHGPIWDTAGVTPRSDIKNDINIFKAFGTKYINIVTFVST